MSSWAPAEQVEHAFSSKRLGNWETPADDKTLLSMTMTGTIKARTGRTGFIVDSSGHLLPGVTKFNTSFVNPVPVHKNSFARWPATNPAIPHAGSATMGYKGRPTDYLPSNTVTKATVEIPGCKESNYNFM